MPELKDREKDEKALLAMLLLLFATEDMSFWASGYQSPQWFDARLQRLQLDSRFMDISRRAQDAMLDELGYEVNRGPLDARMRQLAAFYRHELSYRMARHHAKWIDVLEAARRQNAAARRRGEKIEEIRDPVPEDIYPVHAAKREAVSSVTDFVSLTEITTGGLIENTHGVKLEAIWRTEPGACPICEPLNGASRAVWSKQFPKGPKAHAQCKCHLSWHEVLGE
jgi:hypothetical protein